MPGAAVTVGRGSLGEPPLPPTAPVPPVLLDDPPPEPAVALPPPPPCPPPPWPPLPAAAASTGGPGSLGEHDTATVSAANDATIARIFMEVRAVAVSAVLRMTA
ncbi:hypothetical protein BE04_15665 [Sorangium cellulosum]|uniref:Uncharacterized protein n=2 Tax=Sorangium cellulosum TaxID=56 RepID=A0A150PQP4_SORCE|nr:hypothetical protein SCE1572_06570 [Sorangium cellulosum So0157-2]KYF57748.1 hypothetical protein BE04_15665 [Sorangium cellulosum]